MSSEAELFVRLAEDRLRQRCRWAGMVLVLSFLVPYEVVGNQPQFLWQLFGELPAASVVAGVAMPLAGVVVLLARHFARQPSSLGIVVLSALVAATLVHRIGVEASAWAVLPLPKSFVGRASSAYLALALTAAGADLSFRSATRRCGRVLLVAAVVVAALFYAWPGRGLAPGVTVWRMLVAVVDMPTARYKLGAATIAIIASWPAVVALMGLIHLRRPPRHGFSAIGMMALFGFPLVVVLMLLTWSFRQTSGAGFFGALGSACEIAAQLSLLAGAFDVIGVSLFRSGEQARASVGSAAAIEHEAEKIAHTMERGDAKPHRVAALASVLVVAVSGAQWWLARPPDKGVAWRLSPATKAGDKLYGTLIPRWSAARWRWHSQLRTTTGASARLQLKASARAMKQAARAIDADLAASLDELDRAAGRVDITARGWFRLVAEVNQRARAAALPYYLDPEVAVRQTSKGLRRRL